MGGNEQGRADFGAACLMRLPHELQHHSWSGLHLQVNPALSFPSTDTATDALSYQAHQARLHR